MNKFFIPLAVDIFCEKCKYSCTNVAFSSFVKSSHLMLSYNSLFIDILKKPGIYSPKSSNCLCIIYLPSFNLAILG